MVGSYAVSARVYVLGDVGRSLQERHEIYSATNSSKKDTKDTKAEPKACVNSCHLNVIRSFNGSVAS